MSRANRRRRGPGLEFLTERREALLDGRVVRTAEPAGTLYLGLAFDCTELDAFHGEFDDVLQALSARAFASRFAGWRLRTPPIDDATLGLAFRAEHPSWLCFVDGDSTFVAAFHRVVESTRDGNGVRSTGS